MLLLLLLATCAITVTTAAIDANVAIVTVVSFAALYHAEHSFIVLQLQRRGGERRRNQKPIFLTQTDRFTDCSTCDGSMTEPKQTFDRTETGPKRSVN